MKWGHGLIIAVVVMVMAAVAARQWRHQGLDNGADGTEVIRIAHIFLETREAIDTLGRAYEEHCRQRGERVRVIQVDVPHRLYASWFSTQLLSHDTPEILAIHAGSTTERLAR